MPDITRCSNGKNKFTECQKADKCYRWTAKPTPLNQSYSNFYSLHVEGEDCEYYIPIKE